LETEETFINYPEQIADNGRALVEKEFTYEKTTGTQISIPTTYGTPSATGLVVPIDWTGSAK